MSQQLGGVGQRAQMTIMFTDLSDSTKISSLLEPEIYSDLLERIRDEFLDIVRSHGGIDIRIDGDGFIFAFGYPTFFEDGSRRAVNAALEINNHLELIEKEFDLHENRLQMHTGIHSGILFVKEGDLSRGRYEIIGDATNITARLCEIAMPGDIIVTDESLGRSENYFQISEQFLVAPKSNSKKLLVKKVVGRNKSGDRKKVWAAHSTTFVGRDDNLKWLEKFVMSNGAGFTLAHIQAEPGMGKTRLLHEFSNRRIQQNQTTHIGTCDSYLGAGAYHPITQIFKSLLLREFGTPEKRFGRSENELSNKLYSLLKKMKRDAHAASPSGLVRELLSIIKSAFTEKLVIIIDDWQWVDDKSRDIIDEIVKQATHSIKVILASRVEDAIFLEMNNAQSLNLSALPSRHIQYTIKNLVPGVEPFTLARIESYSGGNPLFIEELCHAARHNRFDFENNETGSWMNSLVHNRFKQLPKNLSEIVKISAIIGHQVPRWLINEIADDVIREDEISALRKSDFLYPSQKNNFFRFKHGITRDVIYGMIHLKERQHLHNSILDKLRYHAEENNQPEPHEALAYHSRKAGKANVSMYHSRIAGEAALSSFSLDRAQRHFKNALEQSEKARVPKDEKLSLLRNYGLSCVVDPSKDQTPILEAAVKAAKLTRDPKHITWSEYWLGFNLYGLGYPKRSITHFNNSLKACQSVNNKKLETQLFANLGQAYAAAGEYGTAYEYLDQAINIKMQKRSGHKSSAGLAYAVSCKGFALGEQGYFEKAMDCFSHAIEVLEGTEHSASTSILNQRAVVNLWHGNFEEALSLSEQTFELSRRMHSRYNFAQSVFITSAANFNQTRELHYIDKMIESTNWLVYDGTGQNMSLNYGALTEALCEIEDWSRARIFAARGLNRIRAGDRRCESQIFRSLALVAKAGLSSHLPDFYLEKAKTTAQHRQSHREIENNRVFELTHFG